MRKPWTQAETDWITAFSQTDNIHELYFKFCKEGECLNWHPRTEGAFITKFKRLGESRVAELGGWSCAGLAQLIQTDRDRVHDWVAKGFLSAKKVQAHRRITCTAFKNFAKKHPDWLTGIDTEYLQELLPQETIEAILKCPVRTRGIKFQVQRSDTGEQFDSIRDAARRAFYSRDQIKRSIQNKTAIDGVYFTLNGVK